MPYVPDAILLKLSLKIAYISEIQLVSGRRTYGRTDRPSYRDVRTHLKTDSVICNLKRKKKNDPLKLKKENKQGLEAKDASLG